MESERPASESQNLNHRIDDPDVAREAAEAERPLRNGLYYGKDSLKHRPSFRRYIESLANRSGEIAAEDAQRLKTVRTLIIANHDILMSAGVLDMLLAYADQLEGNQP